MSSILDKLLYVFYPNKCLSCGEIIGEDENFCELCSKQLKVINPKNRCLRCGNDKKNCRCKLSVYRFAAVVSVYEKETAAQNTVYRYKFSGKLNCGDFLAHKMAECVKNEFKDIFFDLICFVPTSRKSYVKYGFNHTAYLCERIADELDIEMENLLKVASKRNSQHNSSYKERFENVKGKYICTESIKNKTVLLVDDIKTSGATLDECAKQLLFAGADEVYCVTALSTYFKKVEKKEKL